MNDASIIISVIATILAAVGIWQTYKISKINSNQFIFDRRLEIISLFKAVMGIKCGLYFEEISDENKKWYCDMFKYEERSKQLFNIMRGELAQITNHALFYEMMKISDTKNIEEFNHERIQFLLFKVDLNEKIESIDYVFSDDELKQLMVSILTKYVKILGNYVTIFYGFHNLASDDEVRVLLLSYQKLSRGGNELKEQIEAIDKTKIKTKIKKELTVF